MRFWHLNMTLLKVKQGHFETAILILHNFFVFYFGQRCLEAKHSKYIHDLNAEYSDAAV